MSDQFSSPQAKRAKQKLFTCILCEKPCFESESHSPKDLKSWNALLEAAKIRNYAKLLKYEGSLLIPDIVYHAECRKPFVNKKTLDRLLLTAKKMGQSNKENQNIREQRKPGSSILLPELCLFCEGKKYTKTRAIEPLRKCEQMRVKETIKQAAFKKNDFKMVAIASEDLIASEARYHATCYKQYTAINSEYEPVDSENIKHVDEAIGVIKDYIDNILSENIRIITMKEIYDKISKKKDCYGIDLSDPSTKRLIKRKILSKCENSIDMVVDSSKLNCSYLVPHKITMQMMVEKNMELENKIKVNESSEVDHKKLALKIRNEVKEKCIDQEWPPNPNDPLNKEIPLPDSLESFLSMLLDGHAQNDSSSHKVIQSIAQDCVYAITNRQYKPPKHLTLPFAVKCLTGNVEIIKMLNRLGHGISYSQLSEIETALCLSKINENNSNIPSSIIPCIPIHLAYDNIDRLEETLSGAGTSHRVNGILIQPDAPTVPLEKVTKSVSKSKKRTIPSKSQPLLQQYISGKRIGPTIISHVNIEPEENFDISVMHNLIWALLKSEDKEGNLNLTPSWTGFNILTRVGLDVTPDKIEYLPTINAPATELSTVQEIMKNALDIADNLDLDEVPVCLDQALYAKATEVVWKEPVKYKKIVLTMGTFHTICTMLAIIGKRFREAGLRDLAVESGIISEGSIDQLLDGRHYNRGIRFHKLLYGAFLMIQWRNFLKELRLTSPELENEINNLLKNVETLSENVNEKNFKSFKDSDVTLRMISKFNDYRENLRRQSGELAGFWMSYVDMVSILLGLIRASREGDWRLHLHMVSKMIPWCFAYDRLNYARYLPCYLYDMSRLQIDHPNLHNFFINGGFSVQLDTKNPFGRIPIDQAIEETINKDTQTPGGTKGFSLKSTSLDKYYIGAEFRSASVRNLRQMTNICPQSNYSHPDLQKSRRERDHNDMIALVDLVDQWKDPFDRDVNEELIVLSSGITYAPCDRHRIMNAEQIGANEYERFKSERLKNNQTSSNFHDRLKKVNLKTSGSVKKVHTKNKEVVLKADHELFGQMVLIAGSRNLEMLNVFKYPLGPVPWSLSDSNGNLKKTNKACLAKALKKGCEAVDRVQLPSASIIDGMMLVHRVKGDNLTFGQVAEDVFNRILIEANNANRIDAVFDTYLPLSIKFNERSVRGSIDDRNRSICNDISPSQIIKNWTVLMHSSASKNALISFLVSQWKEERYRQKLGDRKLYVGSCNSCIIIESNGFTEYDNLASNQEEADGRLILHALDADKTYPVVTISANDTDVFILCLAFASYFSSLMLKSGTTKVEIIDVKCIASSLGFEVCRALVGMHAFTGCDTVSAFSGRGKLSALKLIKNDENMCETMKLLGEDWTLGEELFGRLNRFTCSLYATHTKCTSVNELRYEQFRLKKGKIHSAQIPPCEDCLLEHAKRANYQAAIWKKSSMAKPLIPNPDGNGWQVNDGVIKVKWMSGAPAPDAILDFLSCNCKNACKSTKCSCMMNSLRCTPMCRLQTCTNMATNHLRETPDRESDSDEDQIY